MRYVTKIQALDPLTKKLKTYCETIDIPVETIDDANKWCQNNYKGYMWVVGFWEGEVEATDEVVNHHKGKCQCESGGYMDGLCFNCGLLCSLGN